MTRTVGYVGAGTVEFLVTAGGQFYFLEFNTRLQVEHPVTECVHGLDLVALQLAIAEGLALPPGRPPPPVTRSRPGCTPRTRRLTTARPSGPSTRYASPTSTPGSRYRPAEAGLRLDSGVEPGSEIGPHYDPMLAKLIAWAPTRRAAVRRLAAPWPAPGSHGPATNRDLLASVLRHPRFLAGQADTSLLDGYDLAGLVPSEAAVRLAAVAATLAIAVATRRRASPGQPAGRLAERGLPAAAQVLRRPARASRDGVPVGPRRVHDCGPQPGRGSGSGLRPPPRDRRDR